MMHMSLRWGLGAWGFGAAINISPRWGYVGLFIQGFIGSLTCGKREVYNFEG